MGSFFLSIIRTLLCYGGNQQRMAGWRMAKVGRRPRAVRYETMTITLPHDLKKLVVKESWRRKKARAANANQSAVAREAIGEFLNYPKALG